MAPHGDVVVVGGSIAGASTALMLARAGRRVTLVEPEPELLTVDEPTLRPGAPQTVHAHGFMCRSRIELATRLPDVLDAAHDAGAVDWDFLSLLPAHLQDGGRPGDEDFVTMKTRRVTLDRALWGVLAAEPGIEVVEDRVTELLVDDGRPPGVRGVRTRSGHELRGDVVVDAGGRRSPVRRWLSRAGIVQPAATSACGVQYHTLHLGIGPGERPPHGFAVVAEYPTFVILQFFGDDDTAMLAIGAYRDEPLLRAFTDRDVVLRVLAESPPHAPWLAMSEVISPLFVMGAFDNVLRRLVADGEPLVLGLHQVGDAHCLTNPTRGRGMSLALAAVGRLCDLLAEHPDDHRKRALEYDAWVERVLGVYWRESAAADLGWGGRFRANLAGRAVPPHAPGLELPPGSTVSPQEFDRAADADPDLMRAALRAAMLLDDDRRVGTPEVQERVRQVVDGLPDPDPEPPPTGGLHDRAHLEEVLAPGA